MYVYVAPEQSNLDEWDVKPYFGPADMGYIFIRNTNNDYFKSAKVRGFWCFYLFYREESLFWCSDRRYLVVSTRASSRRSLFRLSVYKSLNLSRMGHRRYLKQTRKNSKKFATFSIQKFSLNATTTHLMQWGWNSCASDPGPWSVILRS